MTKKSKLTDFTKQKKNANKHTPRGLDLLAKSMSKNGWIGAMTAAADGEIFDGSARLETVESALPNDPIVIETDGKRPIIIKRTDIKKASDPKAVRLALEANRIQQVDLNWDVDVLAEIAARKKELIEDLFNESELKKLGVDMGEPEEAPEAQVDKADELLKKWKVKTGDLWEIGEHRLLCGDSTDPESYDRLLDRQITMTFTDPPWNVAIGKDSNPKHRQREGLENDDMNDTSFTEFLSAFISALEPHLLGDLYCVLGNEQMPRLDMELRDAGFHWSAIIIWVKDIFVLGRSNYHRRYEPIWYGWPNKSKSSFCGGRSLDDVWEVIRPKRSEEHPTMKPVELVETAIKNSSKAGDIVCDPFSGSGTTLVACERLHRKGRAIEIAPKYVAVALQRLADMGLKPKLICSPSHSGKGRGG